MSIKFTITLAAIGFSYLLQAQGAATSQVRDQPVRKHCGTETPAPEWDAWFNNKVAEYKAEAAQNKRRPASFTIPVIVHIIHGGQTLGSYPNITQAQVISQIKVLNDDFAGQGYHSNLLAATGFSTVGAANSGINFCLAQLDPNGNVLAEPGIERIDYNAKGWQNPVIPGNISGFKNLMDNTIKAGSIWDPTRYFNIWVSEASAGIYLLGYATFPDGSTLGGLPGNLGTSTTDGIWVLTKCFGTTGLLDPLYDKGRTATHEAGHWLGLRHIGGDASNPTGDCSATDFCDDTPPQKGGNASGANGQNFGAPAYPLHVGDCGSTFGDMFMNFMDYTDDQYLFTPDQNIRIQTTLQNGIYRQPLDASAAVLCTGLPVLEVWSQRGICSDQNLQLVTQNNGIGTISYTWIATPSAGVVFSPSDASANPLITFPGPGTYNVMVYTANDIGYSNSSSVVNVVNCVGISARTLTNKNISVAPNPASGLIKIRSTIPAGKDEKIMITVHNSLGVIVTSGPHPYATDGNYRLNIEELPDGIYFVAVDNGSERYVKRLIVAQ